MMNLAEAWGLRLTGSNPARHIKKYREQKRERYLTRQELQHLGAVLADPKTKQRLADLGGLPSPTTPTQFGNLIADETERWGKVIRAANIKAE